jgi:hypothetical protein
MKLTTDIRCENIPFLFALEDNICVIGSCFADAMGQRLAAAGFHVLDNPFGTLYNPASVAAAVARLDSGEPFTADECVEMGAGAGRVCSFAHHTRFARPTAEEFLSGANGRLAADAAAWATCNKVIVTLGSAWVWRAQELPGRPVVANCLKRPAREFARELLSVDACAAHLRTMVEAHPEKQFLFTVSPIRHLGSDAHENTLSKATLHLAVQQVLLSSHSDPLSSHSGLDPESPSNIAYFPAYEILMDELRDYRFYAEDLVHPSPTAVQIIWERFLDTCVPAADRDRIRRHESAARAARHRPIL